MYLSELFLDVIGEDFSKNSLQHTLTVCDKEYKSRKVSERELIDFYDVVKEFLNEVRILDYEVLQVILFLGARIA